MTDKRVSDRRTGAHFRTSEEDIERLERQPKTPQTEHPAYRLAFNDEDFLTREELRPVRLQLELLKPHMLLDEQGIDSTVVVFGSARIPEPGKKSERDYNDATQAALQKNAKYYEQAREFAQIVTEASKATGGKEWVICSGGGPGIMEAANRGADEVDGRSIALNIVLPFEALPNPYVTPSLSFQFHYFAIRKMHFLLRAKAVCIFPGGFGTLDEFFEVITLIQTQRVKPMPILIFGKEFWEPIINFEALADAGTVSHKDLELFEFVDTPQQGWDIIRDFYGA
ncbi:MAG: LOG family protein [Hellea sp.]|nr:LOG family protein [Hellea sp.]